jgi:hypothetical protein
MNETRKPRRKGAIDMGQILTFTGYLGRDPQLRETRSRTVTRKQTYQRQFVYDHAGRQPGPRSRDPLASDRNGRGELQPCDQPALDRL